VNLWQLVCWAAERMPNKVIVADDYGRSLTAVEYRDGAEQVAAALGVKRGDVVSWQLPTALEAPVLMAALARLHVAQNPIIPVFRHREVRAISREMDTTLIVVPETWRGFSHGDMARELDCRVLTLDFKGAPGSELRLPMGDPSTLPQQPSTDADWVYYSSGTTADPKGAKHTDSTLIAASRRNDRAGLVRRRRRLPDCVAFRPHRRFNNAGVLPAYRHEAGLVR
jgi:cyclohexanecarboxylate-CoA ligase